jgi:uncharacterized protein (DUF1778 family)
MTTRDKVLVIRLTQPEHDAISKAAEADQRPVAVFIRLAALEAAAAQSYSRSGKQARKPSAKCK